ncbi:o-succinylbenzoate synthase [Prosthecochloris sp. GSB1]|uniref:o-succinylbenzoate synthase n=1 Tax=Prosthecochloris sp. GSB1 TaxID=281093 RepID=UPI000B8CE2BA|nr:o-succinylbenzoate synthase [Prosthecochloris sp. GSB1]ASQ91201.1 o-succinylbenzoate synthase [Prosthecochloris sp. GSB1]
MKPDFVSIYRYSIPFVRPVPVRRSSLGARDGLVIGIGTADGRHTGFGEVAPLPGLHEETLSEALGQCRETLPSIAGSQGAHSLEDAGNDLPERLCPSVRCGIEMALLNFQAAVYGRQPSFPGAQGPSDRLPLNALLFGNTRAVLSMAEEHFRQGYRTFKLKVRSSEPDIAVEQALALYSAYGDDIELRLDSNRTFTLDEACMFFGRIPPGAVMYVEEPLVDPFLIPEFFERTGIPAALDESLWMTSGIWNSLPHDCLGGLVLKPSRIGSFSKTLRFALEAEVEGIPAVVSSAFETGVGIGFYARFASMLSAHPAACGLDTFRQLERDILKSPFRVENGCLLVGEAYAGSLDPDLTNLEPVETWTL